MAAMIDSEWPADAASVWPTGTSTVTPRHPMFLSCRPDVGDLKLTNLSSAAGSPEDLYGPNGPAVIEFLTRARAATDADIQRIFLVFDPDRSYESQQRWHETYRGYVIELGEAAMQAKLEEAAVRAWFDGMRAGVWVTSRDMNGEYFYTFFWNSRTEVTYTEASACGAAAIALEGHVLPATFAALTDPWRLVSGSETGSRQSGPSG